MQRRMNRGAAAHKRRAQRNRPGLVRVVFAYFGLASFRRRGSFLLAFRFGFGGNRLARTGTVNQRWRNYAHNLRGRRLMRQGSFGNRHLRFLSWRFLRGGLTIPLGLLRWSSLGSSRFAGAHSDGFAAIVTAQLFSAFFIDRAGVSNFLGNSEFVQFVDDLARLHFQLPRQFIDSNLTHIKAFRFYSLPQLTARTRPTRRVFRLTHLLPC
jgi:hypothetical protein